MSDTFVKFPSPVSRKNIGYLITEYFKYVLYLRGQFPLPLDQLKKSIRERETAILSPDLKIDGHPIFRDYIEKIDLPHKNLIQKRSVQVFVDTVTKFDDYFTLLCKILQDRNDVMEVILSLGGSTMSPRELHRIAIPVSCIADPAPASEWDEKSKRMCCLQFFKTVMCQCADNVFSDNLMPISVMLLLQKGSAPMDCMELKKFYAPPKKCLTTNIVFEDICACSAMKVINGHAASASGGMWVKLKPDLKGFKSIT